MSEWEALGGRLWVYLEAPWWTEAVNVLLLLWLVVGAVWVAIVAGDWWGER